MSPRTTAPGSPLTTTPALLDLLRRHRVGLDRLLVVGAAVAVAAIVVAAALRTGDWPAQRFLLVYFAPVLAYGAAWLRDRLARIDRLAPPLLVIDAFAFTAGALRAAGGWGVLPYSGHMLFLSHAVATPGPRSLRLIALGLVAMTSWFKLALWHDVGSWGLGLAMGLALAGVRSLLARQPGTRRSPEGAP